MFLRGASYTPAVVDEPVRGRLPDPGFYSLSGFERYRALIESLGPLPPVRHLTGARATHAEQAAMVGFLPELTWFQLGDGTVDTRFAAWMRMESLALTLAPPATTPGWWRCRSRTSGPAP